MTIVPTVSVSFKKGDKRSIVVINRSDFDEDVHVMRADKTLKPAPKPKPAAAEENHDAVDITEMTVAQAKRIVSETDADHILEAFFVAESAGKARKGILAAITKKRGDAI